MYFFLFGTSQATIVNSVLDRFGLASVWFLGKGFGKLAVIFLLFIFGKKKSPGFEFEEKIDFWDDLRHPLELFYGDLN